MVHFSNVDRPISQFLSSHTHTHTDSPMAAISWQQDAWGGGVARARDNGDHRDTLQGQIWSSVLCCIFCVGYQARLGKCTAQFYILLLSLFFTLPLQSHSTSFPYSLTSSPFSSLLPSLPLSFLLFAFPLYPRVRRTSRMRPRSGSSQLSTWVSTHRVLSYYSSYYSVPTHWYHTCIKHAF